MIAFNAAVFIAFVAVLAWAGWLDEGWRSLLLLIAAVPFSVWVAKAIIKRDEKQHGR